MSSAARGPAGAAVAFDAVILTGGRSSRLGGVAKSGLTFAGRTLLAHTCEAAREARRLVVVGANELELPARAELVREEPAFGGPAAAVAAAVARLRDHPACWTLVLACDMPFVADALPVLFAEALRTETSVLANDGGREQPLAALYRWDDLAAAVGGEEVRNLSMRALLARVQWTAVDVPAGSTHDVDTWADAQKLGVEGPDAGI